MHGCNTALQVWNRSINSLLSPFSIPNQVDLTFQNREILMKTIASITVEYGKKIGRYK